MSGKPKPKSRWAETEEEDARLEAKLRRDKEEKRRKKADKARRLQEKLAATDDDNGDDAKRPYKRQKLTPETRADDHDTNDDNNNNNETKLLRFEVDTWRPSRSVEGYEKLNDIEEGTYGWVARATQLSTGRIVALKRLKLEPSDPNGLPVTGLREIQILKDCSHDNIVAMQEVVVGELDTASSSSCSSIFLVLEFVEHDLKTVLEDMPEPFLSSEVKRLLLQLAAGVAYLHDHWILHRDLKTSNLLLSNRGRLKIADFGMARYVGDPAPANLTQLVVTLWYRSPELLLGERSYGSAVDMWSVGCIFAELITREPLLQGSNEVDQMANIFDLCGIPSEESWPDFRRLPNARSLRLPKQTPSSHSHSHSPSPCPSTASLIRNRFPNLTSAGAGLLADLLSLDPSRRPSAKETLAHPYFQQDPKPKPESMFPTFPSKAGQEKRRRREPHAPARGQAPVLGDVDFSGIFHGREREERGAGFTLRMV